MLGLLLIVRILYFIMLPIGVFETPYPYVGVLNTFLADLPSVLFLWIFCLLFYQWASIYHFSLNRNSKMKKYILQLPIIAVNVSFMIFFIAILIYFFYVSNSIKKIKYCNDNTDKIRTSMIISLIYKIMYAFDFITLTILLSLYSNFLVKLLQKSGNANKSTSKKKIKNLLILAMGCCIFLVLQTIVLIYSASVSFSSSPMEPWSILIEISLLEMIPSLVLCYMFGFRNINALNKVAIRTSAKTRTISNIRVSDKTF